MEILKLLFLVINGLELVTKHKLTITRVKLTRRSKLIKLL
jgi:hypothetical protein